MNLRQFFYGCFSLALLAGVQNSAAKGKPIAGINSEGELLVQGDITNVNLCWIEWAPKISGPWSSDFNEMSYFLVKPGHERAVRVPFFYRVQCLGGDGTVLYLPLDGDATDHSGAGNHATEVSSGLTYTQDAVRGQAAEFHGNDFIRIPHSDLFTFGPEDSFSFTFWFNAPTGDSTEILLAKMRSDWNTEGVFSYHANLYKPGNTHFDAHFQLNESHGDVVTCNGFSFVPDTWQHFAFTYSNRIMTTFVDGVYQSTQTNTLTSILPADHDLFLGVRDAGGVRNNWYTGKMDEVMAFNRALAEEEVLFHYRAHQPAAAAKEAMPEEDAP